MSFISSIAGLYQGWTTKRSKVNIVLSVNNNSDKIVFPVVLAELPEISVPQANSTFQAITGDINVIGEVI